MQTLRPIIAVVSLLVLLFVTASSAQNTAWDAPALSVAPADLWDAASRVPATEGADVEVLLDDSRFVFDAQGRATATYHLIYRATTPAGVRGSSSLEADWEPWHEEHPEIHARVITPDKVAHSLDPSTIAEAPAKTSLPDVFTDSRILQAPLPAMAPGAIVEQLVTVREKAPLFERGVVRRVSFRRQAPIYRERLVLDSPSSLPLKFKTYLLPAVTPLRTTSAGRNVVTFEAGPIPRATRLNPYIPTNVPLRSMVAFATGQTWKDVAAKYSQMVDEQIAGANVSSLIGDLGNASREKKIEQLLSRLQQEVRYTGVEFAEASFVPRTPNETLMRKYGDCKDQAALLVTMLRRSGIPAYLALVSTDPSPDADPDLPGLGAFTHAIVYVPGTPALWIDPTYDFGSAGQLPPSVQGRLALIVRPESDSLVRTSESTSADNRNIQTREFILAELGPARVIETTEASGTYEQRMRSFYGGTDAAGARADLERYVKSYYAAESLSDFEISAAKDMAKPFKLRIEGAKAGRGVTDMSEAAVAIPTSNIFEDVEDFVDSINPKTGHETGDAAELFLPAPSINEWRYRIVPPPGFVPRPLPENQTQRMGHAVFTQEYETGKDGVISATIRFDTGKRAYSLAEVAELRDALEKMNGTHTVIVFEQSGQAYLEAGKIREALEEFRKLSAMHPNEALHHAQIARALLAAGIGYAAREEARHAVSLEPSSSVAHGTLGFVLEHSLIGRPFGKGFDLRGAEAEYRKAKELDPSNTTARMELAILLEHDAKGVRYAPGSKLSEGISEYREIKEQVGDSAFANNLPIALLQAGRYAEAKEATEALSANPQRQALIVTAVAAKDGAAAAQREVNRLSNTDEVRRQLLASAGESLFRLRKYAEAAELMTAAARGSRQAAELIGRASLIRGMRRSEEVQFSNSDPASVVKKMFVSILSDENSIEGLKALMSRHFPPSADETDAEALSGTSVKLRAAFSAAGIPNEVVLDLFLTVLEFNVDGDDQTGFKLRTTPGPIPSTSFYVTKENSEYRLLGLFSGFEYTGKEILERLQKGDLDGARRWLDWVRADVPLAGGDDPLGGLPFARFWEKGKNGTADEIRYAAASLLTHAESPEAIDILKQGRARATSDNARRDFDLAIVHGLIELKRFEELLPLAQQLYQSNPRSDFAFSTLVMALERLDRVKEAEEIAQQRLDRNSDDDQAIRLLAQLADARDDTARSRALKKRLVTMGKAGPGDLNNLAWDALVADAVTPEDIRIGQQAVQTPGGATPVTLHTLASLYAEINEASQARDLLLQSMDLRGREEPDLEDWYVLGRIAEQFGVKDAAVEAYNKVGKPKQGRLLASSVYSLAQRRLAVVSKSR